MSKQRKPGDKMAVKQERRSKKYLFHIFMSPELVRANWHLIQDYYLDGGIWYESPDVFIQCAQNRDVDFYGAKVEICDQIFSPTDETQLPAEKIFNLLEI